MVVNPEAVDIAGFSNPQIAEMPLHAVTEVLGSDGLVRRFGLEIARFSAEEKAQLNGALAWAMELHAEDKRFREPATNHILRVAIRIMHHYGVSDVNLITAALLHDSVEDHVYEITGRPDASKDDALLEISARTNPDIAMLVGAVTNPEYEKGRDKLEQYQEHVDSILSKDDPRVRILKVSDFTDNAMGVLYMPAEGAEYRARRYSVLVSIFEKAILDPSTPLSSGARAHIVKQLAETQRRLNIFLK